MNSQHVVEKDGKKLWTELLGERGHPPVLLIAGAGAHAHFWSDPFCEALVQEGFCVIRFDHRDVGLSSDYEEPYELKDLAEDLITILNDYNFSAAHLVGHSMGGYIAQLAAAYHPDRVLSTTLISCGPVGERPELKETYSRDEQMVLYETWQAMLGNKPTSDFEESLPGFMGVWERLNGKVPVDTEMARNYTEELYTRSKHEVGVHTPHVSVMDNVARTLGEKADIFSQIKCPVLIIHGEEDYLVGIKRGGEALANALPKSKYEPVADMGHMLFNRNLQDKLVSLIIHFLHANFPKEE
ncbi:MAG: Rhodomycin D methylesterase DauP [Chlamydiae bacterium]|nr:Rhodomycin D methylesterase DauP [Chlamydiota bacterium]